MKQTDVSILFIHKKRIGIFFCPKFHKVSFFFLIKCMFIFNIHLRCLDILSVKCETRILFVIFVDIL